MADENNLNGIILFLDFQKAFDCIEWKFINQSLLKFGFGANFRKWVSILYKDINNCITNNGWISESFKISRGIRHGCPISALLFIIAAEIMAENIRNNENITGIKIGRYRELKLSQLADDTPAFLNSERDIPHLLREIERFSHVSDLVLNMSNTQGLWLGNNQGRNNTIHGIDFSKKTAVKALGIYFSRNRQECLRLNWDKLSKDIQNLLNSWKRRNLTMLGRVTILKTLALSKCNYILQNIPVTKEILTKLEILLFRFLWKDKNDKIKRKQMIQSYENGGSEND